MSKARAMPGMEASGALSVDDDWAKLAELEAPRALGDLAWRWTLLLVATGATALVARARPTWAAGAAFAFGALVVADVAMVGTPVLRRATGPASALRAPPPSPLARAAAADPRYRVYPLDRAATNSNDWIAWGARTVFGRHGSVPRHWDELRDAGLLRRDGFVRGMSVRWVAGDGFQLDDTSHWERLEGGVLARRDAVPRATAVSRVIAVAGAPSVHAALSDPRFDPREQAFTEDGEAAGDYPGSVGARIGWTRDDPDRLAWSVEAPARAFLVVSDAWLPGWSATIDGRPAPIHRVNHALRGLRVDAGRHVVEMRYRTPGAAAGALVTWIGWVLALAAAAWMARPRRISAGP